MIINDVILENRALEPLELTVIGQLKTKRPSAGAMFSEVGSYLSQNQFKCLLRWIMTARNATIVRRADGSTPPDNIQKTIPKTKDNAQKASIVVPPVTTATGKQGLDLSKPKQQAPAKPAPKMVAPVKGTRIEDFWKQLKWPSLGAFIKAHPGKVNKNKTGTKWVVHPKYKYSTYQPPPTESTITDVDRLLLDMEVFVNQNSLLVERAKSLLGKRFAEWIVANAAKKTKKLITPKQSKVEPVLTPDKTKLARPNEDAIKVLDDIIKKGDDATSTLKKNAQKQIKANPADEILDKDALTRPGQSIKSQVESKNIIKHGEEAADEALNMYKNQHNVSKSQVAELKTLIDDTVKQLQTGGLITRKQYWKEFFVNGSKWMALHLYKNTLKPAMFIIRSSRDLVDKGIDDKNKFLKLKKEYDKIKLPNSKIITKCDQDAHNIRTILKNHGWLMSSTPTGF